MERPENDTGNEQGLGRRPRLSDRDQAREDHQCVKKKIMRQEDGRGKVRLDQIQKSNTLQDGAQTHQ